MKSIGLKTFLLFVTVSLLQGCMPDSLTKFKQETKPQKTSSGGTVVPEEPPASISYSPATSTFIKNNPIVSLLPTTSGIVDSYSITPTLPAGLGFDTTTGRIFGTPTTFSTPNIYVVTATNSIGSVTTNIQLSVYTQPAGLRYTSTPKVKITLDDASAFTVGSSISVQPLNGATLSGTVTQVLGNILEVEVNSASMGTPFSSVIGLARQVDDAAAFVAGVATVADFDFTSKVQLTMFPTSAVANFPISSPVTNTVGALGQVLDISSSSILVGVLSGSFNPNDDLDNAAVYSASAGSASAINYVFDPGDQIDLRPVISDGEAIEYDLAPALPGTFVAFDPALGFIQGTQNGTTSLSLTVGAENPVGSTATSLSIGPFIAPPENLTISNEFILTVSDNSKFYRGRPISSSDAGQGLVLKRFDDGKSILVRHYEGSFPKDGSIDDSLIYGGEEAVIQKNEIANVMLELSDASGFESFIGSVATTSNGGNGIITYVDLANDEVYLKYLSGTFSDTSNTAASTLNVSIYSPDILAVKATNLRLTATSLSNVNTRFDKGAHITSNNLSAALIHDINGNGTTADIVVDVQREGFADGASLDNYSPYVVGEASVSGVTYEHAFYLYTTEKAVLTPRLPKGDNISYTISPDLPAGLTLDGTTGIISGQPSEPSILKSYTLTAKNITNGIVQQTTHVFKMRVYDDFSIVNSLAQANSVALHREGMGNNISSCRLTKDQLQNGKPYARITVPTPHPFTVGSIISNQFGTHGTVEEVVQDSEITTRETLVVRIMSAGSFSTDQNLDDAFPFAATAVAANFVEARTPNKDVLCRYEISENDLWALGVDFNIKSGKGICDYINYQPFRYYQAAYYKTTNAVVVVENDSSEGVCGIADYEFTGSLDEQEDFKCAATYDSSSGGADINCDDGSYLLRSISYSDDGGTCKKVVTVNEVDCGGKRTACWQGPALDLDEEGDISLQIVSSLGLDRNFDLTSPQQLEPQRTSNRWLANYPANSSCVEKLGNPSDAIHQGRRYNFSDGNWKRLHGSNWLTNTGLTVSGPHSNEDTITVVGGDPTDFFLPGMAVNIAGTNYRIKDVTGTEIILHNRIISFAGGADIQIPTFGNDPFSGGSPFYEIDCKDPGFETIGRIRLQVREWDRFFTPEDEIDVLAQLITSDTVDTLALDKDVVTTTGTSDAFANAIVNGESNRMIRLGYEVHSVDYVTNFGAQANDLLTLLTTPQTAQDDVRAWIRPIKQDSGSGVDGFGNAYNSYADWDDASTASILPAYMGCQVETPFTQFFDSSANYKFGGQ